MKGAIFAINSYSAFLNRSAQYLDQLSVKGVMHLQPNISMFYALSQNYQHLFEK